MIRLKECKFLVKDNAQTSISGKQSNSCITRYHRGSINYRTLTADADTYELYLICIEFHFVAV